MATAASEAGWTGELRDSIRRVLDARCGRDVVRRVVDGHADHDEDLWREAADLGWLGVGIAEEHGGLGLGADGLAVLAEECGRALAPMPWSSSLILAATILQVCGDEDQRRRWLPALARGEAIATLGLGEGAGPVAIDALKTRVEDGRLTGSKLPVPDGLVADFAIVAAVDAETRDFGLYWAALDGAEVSRVRINTIDPGRPHATLTFDRAPAERLAGGDAERFRHALDRAAILTACEQVGGARACLEMARGYAMERQAFGRPIGSFQAVKHRLADAFVEIELAAANAAAALRVLADGGDVARAAAVARLSAIHAFHVAAEANVATHGGMGFTWEADCHLYLRRARQLALALGPAAQWEDRLIEQLEASNVR